MKLKQKDTQQKQKGKRKEAKWIAPNNIEEVRISKMYLLWAMCKAKLYIFARIGSRLSGIRNTRVSVALLVFLYIFIFRFSFQVFVITVFGVFAIVLTWHPSPYIHCSSLCVLTEILNTQ